MSKTLSAVRAVVRQFLSDEFLEGSDQDFKDDEINLYIGQCLAEISEKRPYEVKVTTDDDSTALVTTAASLEVDISNIADIIKVVKAEIPVDKEPPNYRNVSVFGTTLRFEYDYSPAADVAIYLYCWKLHQLTESASTLSPQLERVLIDGTVAYVALGWINLARKQVQEAVSKVSDVDTAISSMTDRVDKAVSDLVSGREYIAKNNTKAVEAIDGISEQVQQATADLAEGRGLIGDKRAEIETALGLVSDQIQQAVDDLGSGRALIDENRATADEAIDNMTSRLEQAIADLNAGRALGFNKVYTGGNPLGDYSNYAGRELSTALSFMNQARGYLSADNTPAGQYGNYASRDLQAARANIDEARGYMALDQVTTQHANYAQRQLSLATSSLQQARGYMDAEQPAIQFGNYASRELSNATANLNQAGGYIREITTKLSITRAVVPYQNWAQNKLTLYQRDLRLITKQRVRQQYPTS